MTLYASDTIFLHENILWKYWQYRILCDIFCEVVIIRQTFSLLHTPKLLTSDKKSAWKIFLKTFKKVKGKYCLFFLKTSLILSEYQPEVYTPLKYCYCGEPSIQLDKWQDGTLFASSEVVRVIPLEYCQVAEQVWQTAQWRQWYGGTTGQWTWLFTHWSWILIWWERETHNRNATK